MSDNKKVHGVGKGEAVDRRGPLDLGSGGHFGWTDILSPKTTTETSSGGSESSTVDRSSSVSMNIPSLTPVVSDENMRMLYDYTAQLLSGFAVDDNSVIGVLKKIDAQIDEATKWSPAKVAVELQDIHAKKALLIGEKMFATYAMLTGKEGASELYKDASEKYGTLDYLAHNLRTDPEGYYARQRLDLYNQMANYTQALGGAVAADRAATSNTLNAIANFLSSKAHENAAKLSAQASMYSTSVQRQLAQDSDMITRMQAVSNFFQTFTPMGLPLTGSMFGRVFNVFKKGDPAEIQSLVQELTDEFSASMDNSLPPQGNLSDKKYKSYVRSLRTGK